MYKKSLAKWEHQQETFIMLSTFGATKEVGGGGGAGHSCYGWKWHFLAKKHYTT